MSKKEKRSNFSFGEGYVVGSETPGYLVGRLLTLVETLGLKDTQEKSFKNLVEQEVWNLFSTDSWRTELILPNLHNEIRYVLKEIKNEQEAAMSPTSKVKYRSLEEYEFELVYKVKED